MAPQPRERVDGLRDHKGVVGTLPRNPLDIGGEVVDSGIGPAPDRSAPAARMQRCSNAVGGLFHGLLEGVWLHRRRAVGEGRR